jgi:hypothetical protein
MNMGLEMSDQEAERNIIFHTAFDAFMSLHEDWDEVDLHMSGELSLVQLELKELLDGKRPMTRDEESVLGELAQAWRKLAT